MILFITSRCFFMWMGDIMPCLVASIIAMSWCHILHPSLFNQFHGPSTITKEEQRVPMFSSLNPKVMFKALNLSLFSTNIDLVVKPFIFLQRTPQKDIQVHTIISSYIIIILCKETSGKLKKLASQGKVLPGILSWQD